MTEFLALLLWMTGQAPQDPSVLNNGGGGVATQGGGIPIQPAKPSSDLSA